MLFSGVGECYRSPTNKTTFEERNQQSLPKRRRRWHEWRCATLFKGFSSGWLGEIIFWSLVLVQFMMTSSCLDDQNRTIIEFMQILLSCLCRLLVIAKCVNPLALILRSPESVTVMPPSGLLIRTLYPLWTDDGASDHGSAYPRTVCKLISS